MKKRYSVCWWLGFDGSIKGTLGGLGVKNEVGVKKGICTAFLQSQRLKN